MGKVGVLCEESGIVRDAFAALGHDAWSCDILPRASPRHIRGDCLEQDWRGFDLLIAFPPCTHLCVSGARHFARKRNNGQQDTGIRFFLACARLIESVGLGAIENPVGIMSTLYRKADQIIQPWQFGHATPKKTCLWLFGGLPELHPTSVVELGSDAYQVARSGRRISNQYTRATVCGSRARARSQTFPGIARAMAEQWGPLLPIRRHAERQAARPSAS